MKKMVATVYVKDNVAYSREEAIEETLRNYFENSFATDILDRFVDCSDLIEALESKDVSLFKRIAEDFNDSIREFAIDCLDVDFDKNEVAFNIYDTEE